MIFRVFFTLLIFFFLTKAYGQIDRSYSKGSNHSLGLKSSFLQIKEAFNLGLVFSGSQFDIEYDFEKIVGKYNLSCETEIGGAILKSRKMSGFNIHFKPIDFSLLHQVNKYNKSTLCFGGNVLLNYNYQLYPDLQSGQSFWLSQIQLSPKLTYIFHLPRSSIEVEFMNSLFGIISRPPKYRDPHYFNINFKVFASNANSDFRIGSFHNFNNTNFRLKYSLDTCKIKFAVGYEFNYVGYYQIPTKRMISHSLLLQIQWNKKSK